MAATPFDHIIIGAGTAGSLLANRLSADPTKRVLLIEAGGKDDYHWIHIPVGYLYCIGNPRTDWLYQTEPDAGLNGRRLRYPRGKTLGGCSSINGMIYMRGQSRDYDQWAALTGEDSWRWDQVLPVFKQHEDHHRGADDFHGAGGEWRIERQRLRWDILDAFAQAAEQAGIPASADFNRGSNEGVGYFEVNQKSGWRWNTAKAFLRPTCYGRRRSCCSSPILPPAMAGRAAWACRSGPATAWRPHGSSPAAKSSSAPAASARCSCCSSPASGRRRTCSRWASSRWWTCRAWAPTCRITCRSAPSSRCKAPAPSTRCPTACGARPASGWNTP
jgi:choline dehydrogenase-like flavoprotein